MTNHLVVAHKTLVGPHVLAEVERRRASGPAHFHLLVPVRHPPVGEWSEGQVEAEAFDRLEEGLARFREVGADVEGSIGDKNPVTAITDLYVDRRPDPRPFDEILISTLPAGPSRWLHLDVVSRARDAVSVPVVHLVAERQPAS